MSSSFFFFFNDTATTEIYTLSLHDALPIFTGEWVLVSPQRTARPWLGQVDETTDAPQQAYDPRSEEHTSELQSRRDLVCRLLLEKKKKKKQKKHNENDKRRNKMMYTELTTT